MVRIFTDSAADFEPEELERMDITCIPLGICFGGEEYLENVNLSKDLFYKLLKGSGEMPKTSQAPLQRLMELMQTALSRGDDVLYITLSSALSGTYQTACMVAEDIGGSHCLVVDSRNATGGQRMVVEYAVRLRDEGQIAPEIAAALEVMRDKIVLYACMDTMEYLYRGGRISHTTYTLGTIANIKPIIMVELEGRVDVPAKSMGMRRGMDFLCKRLEHQRPSGEFPLYVMYTDDRSAAQKLAKRLADEGTLVPEERIIQVGAAIGSHIGPGACGLVYVEE